MSYLSDKIGTKIFIPRMEESFYAGNIKEGNVEEMQKEKIKKFNDGIYSDSLTMKRMPSLGTVYVSKSVAEAITPEDYYMGGSERYWHGDEFYFEIEGKFYCPLKVGILERNFPYLYATSYSMHHKRFTTSSIPIDGKYKLGKNNIISKQTII